MMATANHLGNLVNPSGFLTCFPYGAYSSGGADPNMNSDNREVAMVSPAKVELASAEFGDPRVLLRSERIKYFEINLISIFC